MGKGVEDRNVVGRSVVDCVVGKSVELVKDGKVVWDTNVVGVFVGDCVVGKSEKGEEVVKDDKVVCGRVVGASEVTEQQLHNP